MTTPDPATLESATVPRPRRGRLGAGSSGLNAMRLAVVVIVALAGPLAPPGLRTTLLVTLVYGLYAMAYDVVLGYSDQPSLGHGLFFGVGTYAFLLPVVDHGWALLSSLGVAVVVGGVASALLGLAAVRLTEAFHVIITALFASIGYLLANSLTPVTGGSGGRTVDVPPLDLGVVEAGALHLSDLRGRDVAQRPGERKALGREVGGDPHGGLRGAFAATRLQHV